MNTVKALLPVSGAEHKGGEQEWLGDRELYIYFGVRNQRAPRYACIYRKYLVDVSRASGLVVVSCARWAVHVVG